MERTEDDLDLEPQPRREERRSDRPSALRWFFDFDGWAVEQQEEAFVLA